jgi:hypothetical protein
MKQPTCPHNPVKCHNKNKIVYWANITKVLERTKKKAEKRHQVARSSRYMWLVEFVYLSDCLPHGGGAN